ncbi:uncharacterized protein TRIADDRAFT_63579 [Trichoplax adhaerens]|uniref:Deoxynucleoside kinase domain-containing protein n=1 Tax=Trichoplax adhaerens TaxID=10228 RepID=B3RJJ0_TRIAD|nr:hypothetical protein TRIADDRAFT_63579 [Trichoplax adhaerens]EDV29105.1 hypothetical protein TRIADDRAFT_63579 [Trichoplax adhaerens]|eukprot:XP_002108307.1 hypothetical protein TRIADDRAFT_63579 [Trichoplax adhaerens]
MEENQDRDYCDNRQYHNVKTWPGKCSAFDQSRDTHNIFISVAGITASGKTSVTKALSKSLCVPSFHEPVLDNNYLRDFYRNPRRHGFAVQVNLLNAHFQQQQQIVWQGRGGIQDRSIYEDLVYAKVLKDTGLMEEREYNTYTSLFNNLSNFLKRPNLIVYLDVTPEECKARIDKRGCKGESGITIEYLKCLQKGYEEFITEMSRVLPVIRIKYKELHSTEDIANIVVRLTENDTEWK